MARRQLLPELIMSAKRSVWRMHDHAGEADKEFKQVRHSILEASDYACAYCTMQSSKYQEVHHLDDDHKNNDPLNLSCTCPLCHQVFHLGLVGMKDGGELVYLPELSQVELNQLALVMWLVTEVDVGQFKDAQHAVLFNRLQGKAKTIEGMMGNRRGAVLLRLKAALEGTKFPPELLSRLKPAHLSPSLFANVLMSLTDEQYAKRKELLGGLRLLPSSTRFKERIAHWSSEQGSVLPVHAWYKIVPENTLGKIITVCTGRIDELMPKVPVVEAAG